MIIKRVSPFISQCKKRPITYSGKLIYPFGKVIHPFCIRHCFASREVTVSSLYGNAKSEAHAVAVARVVVVDVAVVVDIAEAVAAAGVRRTQPPDAGGSHGDTCGI